MTNLLARASAFLVTASMVLSCWGLPSGAGDGGAGPVPGGDAPGREVERPDHDGPFRVGFVYESFQGSTKGYAVQVKLFYPARTAGQDTPADASSAPYATIVQLTGFGGGIESLNSVANRITTWGFTCAVLEVNWNDWPYCANVSDIHDLLDQLERDNATAGHRLEGMMDREAFGIHGYSSGGGLCIVDAAFEPRLRAVVSWASAIGNELLDQLAAIFTAPIQFQAGELDVDYNEHTIHGYAVFPAPKMNLLMAGGNHGGPYSWDGMICFFFRYLRNDQRHDTFLFGSDAMNDAANGTYALNYTLANGSFFPPAIAPSASDLAPPEDGEVELSCRWDGYLPLGHPRGAFRWDLDGDGTAEEGGAQCTTTSCSFSRSGPNRVGMWYELGGLRLTTNRSLVIGVVNLPPACEVGPDPAGNEDERLQFSGGGNDTPSDKASLQYSWSFGDGTSSACTASAQAGHAYQRAGNYTATLTVRDDDGAEASDSVRVTVSNVPPGASAGPDITAHEDEEVEFAGEGSDTPSDLAGLECSWDFGDGFASGWRGDASAVHAYTRAGNYTAVLTVRDGDGASGNGSLSVRVLNLAPVPGIAAPREGDRLEKDEEVRFDGSASDTATDAPSLLLSWDFGDGTFSGWEPTARASHAYARSGRFTAVLRARDPDGWLGEARVNVTVRNQPPEVRIASPAGGTADEDERVLFRAEGEDTPSDAGNLTYEWEIDGRRLPGPTAELRFSSSGVKQFRVTARDPEGAEASASGSVTVRNVKPRVTASVEPGALLANESINYSCTVRDTPSDLENLTLRWDFGDGSTSSLSAGSHLFARPGMYDVKLEVEDDDGARALETFTVQVSARPEPPEPPEEAAAGPASLPVLWIGAGAAGLLLAAVVALLLALRRPGAGGPGKPVPREGAGGPSDGRDPPPPGAPSPERLGPEGVRR